MLQLCADGEVRVSATTQRPSAKTVAVVAEGLAVAGVVPAGHPDAEIAAFAWSLLLQAGRLAKADGSKLVLTLEYAATLGLVDVRTTDPAGARDDFRDQWGGDGLDALSRYDGLLAVRRTTLGDHSVDAAV